MLDFLKKKMNNNICSPVDGVCKSIEEVNDEVFSSKMMGDGFAIASTGNVVVAPIEGEVISLFPTNHAFGIRRKDGVEVLVHIGIDTVNMKGKGFEAFVKQGDKVDCGDKMIKLDRGLLEKEGLDLTTMVIFTEGYSKPVELKKYGMSVNQGEVLIP
jgi:PTS system, glucose subfamily, IIA component